jgi:antitoxin component of RelBE/YafQ-DinJ toxin-antitoxin module
MTKERRLNVRIGDEDRERLERVAAHYTLSVAGVIRMLTKREDDAIAMRKPSTKPRKPARGKR